MARGSLARGFGLGLGLDLAVMLAAGVMPGFAQQATTPSAAPSGVPAREGNIWDHMAHQPTAAVGSAEHRAGVAPSPQQARHEDEELARINKQLQQRNGVKNPLPP